jgi:hypothetical protein
MPVEIAEITRRDSKYVPWRRKGLLLTAPHSESAWGELALATRRVCVERWGDGEWQVLSAPNLRPTDPLHLDTTGPWPGAKWDELSDTEVTRFGYPHERWLVTAVVEAQKFVAALRHAATGITTTLVYRPGTTPADAVITPDAADFLSRGVQVPRNFRRLARYCLRRGVAPVSAHHKRVSPTIAVTVPVPDGS